MRQPKLTPNWKQIILAGPHWPENLPIPQDDKLPKRSERILESPHSNRNWKWELWREPKGRFYFLKVWPTNKGSFGKRETPGVMLTVMETFHFVMSNWMPRELIVDLALAHPELSKPFQPPSAPGLN